MRRSGTSESGDVAHLHESQGAINVGPISVQLQTLSGGWCTASFRDRNISNRARILCPLVEAKRLLRESMNHFTVHAIRLPGVIVGAFGRHFAARRNSTCSWHLAAVAETNAKRRTRAMLCATSSRP